MKLIETIPNISEGRDEEKIDKIAEVFKESNLVKLLNIDCDADHNRTVFTIVGEINEIEKIILKFVKKAIELIDLNKHKGIHPRMGVIDVLPFVPIKNITRKEAVEFSKILGQKIFKLYNLPIFLYEYSSIKKGRVNLADLRRGEFENMQSKIKQKEFIPDFGKKLHPTAGITAVGVRAPLIAFNVNLKISEFEVAKKIAKKIRFSSGGLPFCKAIGLKLPLRNISQISMNLTNYKKTSLLDVFKIIQKETQKSRIEIISSEIVGLIPQDALQDDMIDFLKLKNFSYDKILEKRIDSLTFKCNLT